MAFKLHKKAKLKGEIELKDKKVITTEFRISYPHLDKPKTFNGKESYSTSLIFSKDEGIDSLIIAAHNAAIEKWGSDTSKWPSKKVRNKDGVIVKKSLVKMPFKDGDREKPDKEEYENTIFFNAGNSKNQPQIVGRNPKVKIEPKDVKAGDYYRASLIAFAYEGSDDNDKKGSVTSWGVSFSLLNLQYVRKGKPLGGGMSAADEFDEIEGEEEELEDMENEDSEEEDSEESEEENEEEEEEEDERPSKNRSSKSSGKRR